MRSIHGLFGRPLVATPILICAFALPIAGCGNDSVEDDDGASMPAAASTTQPAAGDGEVTILDFKYDPNATTVEAGTEVVWVNEDKADHTATADDDSFDTGVFGEGDEATATLDDTGTYAYHCDLHPFMKGEIVVE